MKFKRKVPVIALLVMAAIMFAGCASGGADSSESPAASSSQQSDLVESSEGSTQEAGDENATQSTDESQQEETVDSADSGQGEDTTLVAYFSYTGNTRAVARQIADLTGADLAEIQRAEEYTDLETEAEAEILQGVHPEITVSADNIEDYDTIFVGYPIWWDEAPAMIGTFLESYDFSGKTIIPFCTSSSDSIDNSLHIFSELCPEAAIAEGLTANDGADIEQWLRELSF